MLECDAFGVRQNVVVVVKKSFSTSSQHTQQDGKKFLMLILTKSYFWSILRIFCSLSSNIFCYCSSSINQLDVTYLPWIINQLSKSWKLLGATFWCLSSLCQTLKWKLDAKNDVDWQLWKIHSYTLFWKCEKVESWKNSNID